MTLNQYDLPYIAISSAMYRRVDNLAIRGDHAYVVVAVRPNELIVLANRISNINPMDFRL